MRRLAPRLRSVGSEGSGKMALLLSTLSPRSQRPARDSSKLRSRTLLKGGGQNRSESFAPIVGPTLVGQAAFRIRPDPFDCPLALLLDELTLVAELAPELSRQDKEARPRHLGLSIHH